MGIGGGGVGGSHRRGVWGIPQNDSTKLTLIQPYADGR